MSFRERINRAQEHELNVIQWLIARKYAAFQFGQGLLNEECRNKLQGFVTNVRWMPDIVVFSRALARHGYIDAKTGRLDTPNHSIEIAAIEAAKAWVVFSETKDYFFVWENGETATLKTVIASTEYIPGCLDGIYGGTGTPFVLLPRSNCSTFDSVFGAAS